MGRLIPEPRVPEKLPPTLQLLRFYTVNLMIYIFNSTVRFWRKMVINDMYQSIPQQRSGMS